MLILSGHFTTVTTVAWSPDGSRLATASRDQTARVWDAATGKELLTVKGSGGDFRCVAWSPDGKRLATTSWGKTAKVWEGGF